jgi:hypothetical protein
MSKGQVKLSLISERTHRTSGNAHGKSMGTREVVFFILVLVLRILHIDP